MPIVTDFGVGLDDGPLTPLAEVGDRSGLHVLAPADADAGSLAAVGSRQNLIAVEFAKFSDGKPARKVIVVPGKLVNIVV